MFLYELTLVALLPVQLDLLLPTPLVIEENTVKAHLNQHSCSFTFIKISSLFLTLSELITPAARESTVGKR